MQTPEREAKVSFDELIDHLLCLMLKVYYMQCISINSIRKFQNPLTSRCIHSTQRAWKHDASAVRPFSLHYFLTFTDVFIKVTLYQPVQFVSNLHKILRMI